MKIIEKLVVSSTAPNNPNVGWVKQKADRSKELLIHDNNSWTPIGGSSSGGGSGSGIDIVDSIDKLDPNAEVGSIASVAVQGNYSETSIRDLYQPDASMLDQNTGTLTQPELLSSVSSLKIFAPADVTNIGFEPVESAFYLVPRDFSMTNETMAMVRIDPSMGVMAQAVLGSQDATQQLILVEFSYDTMSCIVNNDQVEAFNAILANGTDWCYLGDPVEGVITEEQFNTLDLFVNAVAGTRTIADVYVKKDEWGPLFVNTEGDELSGRVSVVENELYTLSDNVLTLNGKKANNITFANYNSYGKVLPNVYTRHTISSTNSVNIALGLVENNNIYNEYILELKCTSTPSSVGFKYPDNTAVTIVWASGIAPTFEAGMTYLISIAEGLGVYSMFPNS